MTRTRSAAEGVDSQRLVQSFLELAQVSGSSGDEHAVAQFVENKLQGMGFSIQYDEAHRKTGGNCGNMLAWWDGSDAELPPLFLSTHLDTVSPTAGLTPVIRKGIIYSDGSTILGADDRAALAAYIEAIQVVQQRHVRCGPAELILTVSEQTALLGSKHLDYTRVRSRSGYVFDSSGDVGQIILRGPYGMYIHWSIQGKPAHLGLAAGEGISAIRIAAEGIAQMRLGQVSEHTVANVGKILGGELGSIIPEHVQMLGEVRSYSQDELHRQIDEMCKALEAAAARHGGKVSVELEEKYTGYDIPADDPHVQVAVRAARRLEIEPYFTETLGGADTNNFRENGLNVFTLGNGFRDIHSFDEHISIENLVNTARLTVGLIEEFATAHYPGR